VRVDVLKLDLREGREGGREGGGSERRRMWILF